MNQNITIINNDGIDSVVEGVALISVVFNSTEKQYLVYAEPESVAGDKATILISQLSEGPGMVDQIDQSDWDNFKNVLVHIIRKEEIDNVKLKPMIDKVFYVSSPKKLSLTYDKKQAILDAEAKAVIDEQIAGQTPMDNQNLYNQAIVDGGMNMNTNVESVANNVNIAFGEQPVQTTNIGTLAVENPMVPPIQPVAPVGGMPGVGMEQPMAAPAPAVENPMVPPIQPVAPLGGMPGVGMEQPTVAPAPAVENPMVPPIQPVAPVGGMPGVGMEQPNIAPAPAVENSMVPPIQPVAPVGGMPGVGIEQPNVAPSPAVENPMVPPIQPVAPVGGMPGVGIEQPTDSFETPMMVSSIPDIPSLDNVDVVNQPVPSNDAIATVNDFDIVNKYYNGEQVDVNQVKDSVSKLQSLIDKVNDKINLALVNNSLPQNDMNYVQQPEMINPISSVNEMVPSMESTINVTPPSVDFNNVIPSNDMNNNSAPMMTPGQEQIIPVDLPPVIMPDGMSSQQNGMSFPNANLGNPDEQQN